MTVHHRIFLPIGAGLAMIAAAGAAQAGGGSTRGCNCAPPPCCSVPSSHQVNVPGVNITPPSINVNVPSVSFSGGESIAVANAQASASAESLGRAQAMSFVGGGGSSYYVDQQTGVIPNLQVEGLETAQIRRICSEFRSVERAVTIEANCLDDKAVPHAASQVMPGRDVPESYEGEIFRCIAGTRMQYTITDSVSPASYGHGQTVVCQKGEALWHGMGGKLECRPQKRARDCNERSLLRRYGPGVKTVKVARDRICVAWKEETVKTAGAASSGSLVLDGGVGGVVH